MLRSIQLLRSYYAGCSATMVIHFVFKAIPYPLIQIILHSFLVTSKVSHIANFLTGILLRKRPSNSHLPLQ